MTSRGLRKELRWRWASAETELNPPDDSADMVIKVYVPGQKKGFDPDFSSTIGDFCRPSVYCD